MWRNLPYRLKSVNRVYLFRIDKDYSPSLLQLALFYTVFGCMPDDLVVVLHRIFLKGMGSNPDRALAHIIPNVVIIVVSNVQFDTVIRPYGGANITEIGVLFFKGEEKTVEIVAQDIVIR
jgi:hypothetical protein